MFIYDQYPYLGICLILFVFLGLLWVLLPNQRQCMVLSGLLSMPYGAASLVFVPEYWKPVLIIKSLTGLEDILFSLINGFLAWAIATVGLARSCLHTLHPDFLLPRYWVCTCSGIGLSALIWFSGQSIMKAALFSMAGLGLFILWTRKELWIVALTGALGFGLLYLLALKGVLLLNPDFLNQWNLANLSGIRFAGIPVEEIIWALGYGGIWPLFMHFVFEGSPIRPLIPIKGLPARN
ncbi:MAG: lycopene cyclase domain-containing protein [Thermodesulfobacteriota bacterium]